MTRSLVLTSGAADVHRVGVHHPSHDALVGVDVGGRNVFARADDEPDLARVAARDALELGQRERSGIDPDAALGPAVGHVDGGVFDRHPSRQRHHFGQRHVLVKTHPALAGAARGVVLHPVALEVRDAAVVEADRHIDDQAALGPLEGFDPAPKRTQVGRHPVDLLQIVAPRAQMRGVEVGGQGVAPQGGGVGLVHGVPKWIKLLPCLTWPTTPRWQSRPSASARRAPA